MVAVGAVMARVPEVAAAYVFGSVARGTATIESDLDVAVVYRDRHTDAHHRLATALALELSRATGFERVDVVDLEEQGSVFALRVLSDGKRAYEGDRERRIDFESDTISRGLDFLPTYELATRDEPAAMQRWLDGRYGLPRDRT